MLVQADAHWLVLDKPAGLPAVPGRAEGLQDCAASRLQARFADALVVHRLDMATSGLMLMARGPEMQRRLSQAFAERRVDKHYLAWVWGELPAPQGTVDLPLSADWPARPRQRVNHEGGKPALTRWQQCAQRVLAGQLCSLVRLQPITGRSHQLRVHLAALGCPILGDTLYAHPQARGLASRLLLHAQHLRLQHPVHGDWQRFTSAAPFWCPAPPGTDSGADPGAANLDAIGGVKVRPTPPAP